MVQDVADLVGIEPGVDGDERGFGQEHREVGAQELGDVRCEKRHAVPGLHTRALQGASEATDLCAEGGPALATLSVDQRGLVGKDAKRALEERERRERIEVNGQGHGNLPMRRAL